MSEAFRSGWPFRHPPNMPFELNAASPQADGLVAWWPVLGSWNLDLLRDYSGNKLHLSATLPDLQTTYLGPSFQIDAAGEAFSITDERLAPSAALTWWVRFIPLSGLGVAATLMSKGAADTTSELAFQWMPAGTTRALLHQWGAVAGTRTATVGSATDVALTYNGGSTFTLYMDGLYDNSGDLTTPHVATGEPFQIGVFGSASPSHAKILEARVYAGELSPAAILALSNPATRWELYSPRVRFWSAIVSGEAPATLSVDHSSANIDYWIRGVRIRG